MTRKLFHIETNDDKPGAVWASDTIGDNPARSLRECRADVRAFQRGECGREFADGFAPETEGKRWRIAEDRQ